MSLIGVIPGWKQMQDWHSAQKAQNEAVLNDSAGMSDAVGAAMVIQSQVTANLVAQKTLARVQAAVAAKQKAASPSTISTADATARKVNAIINGTTKLASSRTPTGTTTAEQFRQQMAGIINGTAKLAPKPNASDNPQARMDQIIFGIDKLPLPKTDVTA